MAAKTVRKAEQAVTEAAKQMDKQPPVSVIAINGFAAPSLIDASDGADVLVVGTRGGAFPHLRLGAVSSQVVHHAKCPIVVVPYDR